jgi:hypothetical protein
VEIYDLTVSQAMTGIHLTDTSTASLFLSGVKLDNNGNGGLWAEGGTVTITRSTISNNVNAGGVFATGATLVITTSTFASNAGGAGVGVTANGSVTVSRSNFINNVNGGLTLYPTGTFSIVGNVFFNNGQVSTGVCGGVCIDTGTNAANRLELNTFVGNRTSTQHAAGIQCSAGTFTGRNNIISGNTGGTNQYSGTCLHEYSIVRPGAVPAGTGNVASDPMFAGAATGNLHLTINSPARGAGDPATDITGIAGADIDGDARQVPPDIGADQY